MDEEVRRLVKRHVDLSFTIYFERGCRFHQGTKDMARYWPEDHVGSQRRSIRRTRKPKRSQEGNRWGGRSYLVGQPDMQMDLKSFPLEFVVKLYCLVVVNLTVYRSSPDESMTFSSRLTLHLDLWESSSEGGCFFNSVILWWLKHFNPL